jgi:competence protein ComEC
MPLPPTYFWNKAPFVRLLIALAAGIIFQWELHCSFTVLMIEFAIAFSLIISYFFLSLNWKYRLSFLSGLATNCLTLVIGSTLVWLHDIRNDKNWFGNNYTGNNYFIVTIEEPLVQKTNSFKAPASVNSISFQNRFKKCSGHITLYFKKDPLLKKLHYGSQIVFNRPLQEIKNSGNPGSFDYQRYSLFQGITHQVNLSANEFAILPDDHINLFQQFIFNCRSWVVQTLQKFIKGEKERGLAEALLIGYKDDLDKNLVQSYTNTGVVHIIAISGMHLALIYALLLLITKPIRRKQLILLRIVLVLSGLWLFTFLAGAQASVVRSAVMFSCIALGEALARKTFIYNTLALSAFVLLCINPFWLWDVGFQLSYAAVASIVTFYKPIYHWMYLPNKALDFIWKTTAISIAAQILTTPISLYHFHQFPVLFLLTNIVAVPLSGLILFGEIFLCSVSWITAFAKLSGDLIKLLIYWMNSYIERIESIPFSLWNGFSINIIQTCLLLIALVAICFWLMEQRKQMLWLGLSSLLSFVSLRSWSFINACNQKQLIVYNVPRHSAIDLISGRTDNFIGDSDLLVDDFMRNFHIQPSRILHRTRSEQALPIGCKEFEFCNKRILILDSENHFNPLNFKPTIDILILSKNPKTDFSSLIKLVSIHQIIIDGSVPEWKARAWKKYCDSFKISCYDVGEKGAFVVNL